MESAYTQEMLWQRALIEAQRGYQIMVDQAYVLHEPAEVLHSQSYCGFWSDIVADLVRSEVRLFDHAARVDVARWEPNTQVLADLADARFHCFVVATLTDLDERIMDGTWQQFLPEKKRRKALPRILSGSRDAVIESASEAGVPEPLLDIWRTTSYESSN